MNGSKRLSIRHSRRNHVRIVIALGATLGLLQNRKWFALSGIATSMVVLHNTRGWYPLLPVF